MDGWEKISIQIWKNLAEKSNFILDIGANTGIYSLIAYSVNTSAKIIAFEPVKRTYVLTKKNFELNQSVNISLITKAVSNVNGNAVFYDVPTLSQYSASLNEKMLESTNDRIQYEVETIRIDSMPEVINNKIDLIKLDVEMHEPEVLEGMIGLIERDKPTILIEILNEEIASKVESLIKDFGYIYFSIDEENRPERIEHIGKSKMYNLLLITKEKAP
jgi:FkbM family methyltransferase